MEMEQENNNFMKKRKKASVIGIDFGNENCVVSLIDELNSNLPKIILNNLSNDRTPTIISFKDNERLIGEEASSMFISNPKNTISSIKKLLELKNDEYKLQEEFKYIPFQIKKNNNQLIISVQYKGNLVEFSPEEIIAMIFSKLKYFVEKNENSDEIYECVISIPGSFGVSEIISILEASKIAELNVLGIINDATSAALCYGFLHPIKEENYEKIALFVEMGQSHLNTEIVKFTKNKLEVLASSFDNSFGSYVFDYAIYNYAIQQFKIKYPQLTGDISSNVKAMCRLLRASTKAKESLSTQNETQVIVESFLADKDLIVKISRNLLEELCKDELLKLNKHINNLFNSSNLTMDSISVVEVSGGGMRLSLIQENLKNIVGKELNFNLDSAHCIAMGAALMGSILHPSLKTNYIVMDPFNEIMKKIPKIDESKLTNSINKNKKLIEDEQLISNMKSLKNEIESYIYSKREQCNNPIFQKYITENEKIAMLNILSSTEAWLIEESDQANLSQLHEKLNELKESIMKVCPKLQEFLIQEEERKKKELEESLKNKPESNKKERDIPRTKKERIEMAKKKKEQGNTLFKENNLEGAISQWNQAIQYFDSVFDLNPEQKKEVDNIKLSCYTNLAISYLKLKNYEKAKDCSSEALIIDEKNVKALFRRAQSFFYLKNIEAAEKDLKKALTIDPQNVEMKKFLKDIQEKKEEQLKKEKNIYSKMFK